MLPERYCVIDVETTGFSPTRDRIVEVACALVDGGRVVGRWATLVNPGMPIPAVATSVHGITDDMVEDAPSIVLALRHVRRLCRGRTVAAHCANFDLSFVGPTVASRGLCTMRLARALFPEAPNHKNQTLRRFLGIDRVAGEAFEAHRALSDALVSAHVLIACRQRFNARGSGQSWPLFVRENAFVRV
jgi:DNA polymerase III epsilon subunit family exonuclease